MSDILTFAEARRLVAMQLGPTEPGFVRVRPDGYESDTHFRVLIDWEPGYEFDAPCIVVEKATGHVERLNWTGGVFGHYRTDKMRPISS